VVGVAQIANDTGLTRQTVYRIKDAPADAEAALAAWGPAMAPPSGPFPFNSYSAQHVSMSWLPR
jgi:Helix-turn-helix domain of resolvase